MMLLKEKIIRERMNENQIYLYKEGIFWKGYNRSAYYFVSLLKSYALKQKHLKNIGEDFVSIGFPDSVFPAILRLAQAAGMAATEQEKIVTFTLRRSPEGYDDWLNGLRVEAKVDEHENLVEVEKRSELLLRELREFPIVRRTPLECQLFLMELQAKI